MVAGRGAGAAGDGDSGGEGEGRRARAGRTSIEGDGVCAAGDSGVLGARRDDAGASAEPHPTSATAPASTTSLVILIWRNYRDGYTAIGADPPGGWAVREALRRRRSDRAGSERPAAVARALRPGAGSFDHDPRGARVSPRRRAVAVARAAACARSVVHHLPRRGGHTTPAGAMAGPISTPCQAREPQPDRLFQGAGHGRLGEPGGGAWRNPSRRP